MLTLTRKVGSVLKLKLPSGEEISILVAKRTGNHIQLVIDAPNDVNIYRQEVEDRKNASDKV
jgi:carbon storage regulator CsrA